MLAQYVYVIVQYACVYSALCNCTVCVCIVYIVYSVYNCTVCVYSMKNSNRVFVYLINKIEIVDSVYE
jgi:hypothetical protein